VGLRHPFASKFLHIAFIHTSTYQIGPPKEDSTYGMLGD